MCFANGKAVSIVEPAVSEVHMTRSTRETIIVPRMAEGFNILITGLNTQVATTTKSGKNFVIIIDTIRFFILPVKNAVLKRLSTSRTDKTLHVPSLIQCVHDVPDNLLTAFRTCVSKISLKATSTKHCALVFNKSGLLQGNTTAGRLTDKTFGMPVFSDCLTIFAPNLFTTSCANWRF